MAPIRRYLRISKYSVLECRIFLENPADEARWLLNEADPAINRVFEAIKPYVLPKLREENERAKGKGKKKKTVKDIVKQDEFEVSIFLIETQTRHSLLVGNKTFKDKAPLKSNNGGRLLAADRDIIMIQDESDEEEPGGLAAIPDAVDDDDDDDDGDDAEKLTESDRGFQMQAEDDKKKLGMKTTYEGFSIWGKVLCLFIEYKGGPGRKTSQNADGNAQVLMQNWIESTQQQIDDDF